MPCLGHLNHDLTDNIGFRYFLCRMKKKIQKSNESENRQMHLLASCASQAELELGSQTIKFGKYVKLLNS